MDGSVGRLLAEAYLRERYEACEDDDVRCLTFFVEASDLWTNYLRWCRDEGAEAVSPVELGEVGKEVFPQLKWRRLAGDGEKVWANIRRKA